MAVLIKYTDNTQEERYFNTREALRWFLGTHDLTNDKKVMGYKRIK